MAVQTAKHTYFGLQPTTSMTCAGRLSPRCAAALSFSDMYVTFAAGSAGRCIRISNAPCHAQDDCLAAGAQERADFYTAAASASGGAAAYLATVADVVGAMDQEDVPQDDNPTVRRGRCCHLCESALARSWSVQQTYPHD
jgi:hypothetical protein